eukprot:4679475-Ditylum_brightwellii.AAC.1
MMWTTTKRHRNGTWYSISKRRRPDYLAQRKKKSGDKEMRHGDLGTSIATQGKGRNTIMVGPQKRNNMHNNM